MRRASKTVTAFLGAALVMFATGSEARQQAPAHAPSPVQINRDVNTFNNTCTAPMSGDAAQDHEPQGMAQFCVADFNAVCNTATRRDVRNARLASTVNLFCDDPANRYLLSLHEKISRGASLNR